MKRLILSMALVAGLSSLAGAQTKERKNIAPKKRAELMSNKLTGELKLSADQSAKVNSILLAQANSIDSVRNLNITDKDKKRGAVKSIMQNTNSRISAVLSPDQQKAYANLKTSRKGHFKDGSKARMHKKTPQQKAEMLTGKLKEKLNLTQDQTTKVSAILLARAAQVDSLKTANKGDRKNNRKVFKSVFSETDAQLNAVLNADQQKAYADWKAQHSKKFKSKRAEKSQG